MHYLLSTFGSAGDVFPMLGLAIELRSRGHRVTLATNGHFQPIIASYGIPFEPLGTEDEYQASIRNPSLWDPRKAFAHIVASMKPMLKRQFDLHVEKVQESKEVVGVTNCLGFGALMAREALKIPVITLHLQPSVIWSRYEQPVLPGLFGPRWLRSIMYRIGIRFFIDPAICPFLNSWRAELGLPPMSHLTKWWHSPSGVIGMFPEWYAKPQPDWPANLELADFPLWNHQPSDRLGDEVQAFLDAGDAPIVFTPGTANVFGQKFFAAAVSACQALGRRGILLTSHPEQLPANLPSTIAAFQYVPLDRLLPRAAAFVHHGGVGSMSQGMLAGIPQVLMPLAHDQFDNAERVRRLGLGDAIPEAKFTAPRLTDVLRKLLASKETAERCRATAERMQGSQGIPLAADRLEAMTTRSGFASRKTLA
jgi:rhamnosyltransferase subunit B